MNNPRATRSLPLLAGSLIAVLGLGCGADGGLRGKSPDIAGPRFTTVTNETGKLTVYVTGPGWIHYPGTATYSASASGGTGPYYYVWSWRPCFTQDGCSSQQFIWLGEGLNMTSASVSFASYTTWVEVSVEARENKAAPYNTGRNSPVKITFGPAGLGGTMGCPPYGLLHNGQPIFPFDSLHEHFVYDPCTAARMYQN